MKIVAKPIDVVAVFSNNDKPIPYKFRYLKETDERIEIRIDKIITINSSKIAGIPAFIYTCQSLIDNRTVLYELKYIVEQYRWELYKI